jgi:hypothetical protein
LQTFKSSLFGDASQPDTFEELLSLCLDPAPDKKRAVRMWRGQGDIDWPIHSAAFRRLALSKSTVGEKNMEFYEKDLLERATHRGFRRVEGHDISDFDLLARLQHHGTATRLVDFTRSALTALWFAVSSEHSRTGVLFGIHVHSIGGYEGLPEARPYDDIFPDLVKFDYPQTWEPPAVSSRIAAQHAQFVYSDVVDRPTGSLKLPKKPGELLVIALSPDSKKLFSVILSEVFDIRYLTLFPDIEGFGYANSFRFHESENDRW